MKVKKTLLFSIIIFSLFSSLLSVNSLSITPDINYTFDQNVLFDDTIDSYNTSNPLDMDEPYNLKYQQEYTETYNATYSFTNDFIASYSNSQESEIESNIDFCDVANIGTNDGYVSIIPTLDGHNKVINLTNEGGSIVHIRNDFSNQTTGIIELWIKGSYGRIYISDSILGTLITVVFRESTNTIVFVYGNGIGGTDTEVYTWNHNWVHIKFLFNTTSDKYTSYVNLELVVDNKNFANDLNSNGINQLILALESGNTEGFYDAIGYSFENPENFDFENDIIGNEPLLWNINPHGGSSVATVERFQESNVLKVIDNDIVNNIHVVTDLNQSIDQSIEYYIAVNDITLTDWYYMRFKESGSGRLLLRIDNNDLDYHNGIAWLSVKNDFIIINTWFKITLHLHDSVNTFDIFIDDTLEGSNLGFITNSIVSVNQLSFESGATETSITYLDNFNINSTNYIDYNYPIGQNLIPYLNTSNTLMEIDKYEFALNDIHTFNALGDDDSNGWIDIEDPSGDKVNIWEEPDGSFDRVIRIDTDVIGDFRGIIKDNLGINGNFIRITWGFFATILDGNSTDSFNLQVESSDSTIILNCKVLGNLSVVYGGSNPNVFINVFRDIELAIGVGFFQRYDFSFLLNYELDRIFFTYSLNGIVLEVYSQPMSDTGKQGLKKVNIGTILNTANRMKFYIDYIGIYNNGISQVDFGVDFGIALIDINNVWNRENYNLLNFIGNGTFHIASTDLYYFYARSTPPIKETTTYYNENEFVNAYYSVNHLFTGLVVLTVLGNNFNFSYLKISGVILKDSSNSYNLKFEHSGVNIHESFFYTDTNNKLQFTHISNDTGTEYIQARFNIDDSTSTDARIHFRSLINNNAYGFFRINYTTTSDFIPFPTVQSTTSIFLTQGKNIRDFLIIISDLDDNTITGLTSGFIDNIKLLYLGNIQISIITLSLVGMLVPLIIILAPTVALRDLYGQAFVIPIFLLMSLILTISSTIPVWLFFIIAISSSLFLIKENIKKDD